MDSKNNNNQSNDLNMSKAEQLKKKANDEYGKGNYVAAIKTYTEILKLSGIPSDLRATIFSNRSVAFLCENNITMAIKDAEMSIQLRSSWWRPYYRLGCAFDAGNQLEKAITQFETALALNPEEKSIKEKLYKVRHQFGIQSRDECLAPHPELMSEEEQMQKLYRRFAPEEVKNLMEKAKDKPYFSNVLKGHQYRDGMGGQKQDYAQAAKHYAEAARLGNPEGMYNLAQLYGKGQGVKQDYDTSIYWLRKAAEMKHPAANVCGIAHAQHSLGLKYTEGVGVKKDLKEAVRWYEMAVKNNFGPSANNLGMFYKNGWGVERSLEKAFLYFQMSADSGDTPGMINLAECYLNAEGTGKFEGDREKALHWLRRAASLGDLLAEQRIQELEERFNDPIGDLFLKFQSMMKPTVPEGMGSKNWLTEEQQQFFPAIKAAAEKGSIVAKEVLTIGCCLDAALEAFKRGDHAQMIEQMAKAIRLDHQLIEMPEMFKPVINKCIKAQPNNINAIVCHINSISTKYSELSKFVGKCLQKFPNDPFLLEMRAICFYSLGQTKEAINLLDAALKKHPNNVRLLYTRGIAYSIEDIFNNDAKMSIKAWDDFLRVAPKDDPIVPAAYYQKAMAYISSPAELIQCFEQGLAAEKLQLPCFLPYNFGPKYQLENIYKLMKFEENKTNKTADGCSTSTTGKGPAINSAQREHVISNPRRKMLLNNLRESLAFHIESEEKNLYLVKRTQNAPLKPKPASMINLVEITLDEMEPDNIYNRSILELKIVDWPVVLTSVMMVVEDKNGHVEKLAIYNWPGSDNLAQMLQTFRPQRTLRVINPYLRIAMDQDRLIRVDDPSYLILGELPPIDKHICNCCGVNDDVTKILKCAKCKMAFYCSKECQRMDWFEFGHKLVCKHLAKFLPVVFGQQ